MIVRRSSKGKSEEREGRNADEKLLRKAMTDQVATSKRKLILQTERVIFYECIVEDMGNGAATADLAKT
jgi:hypothetical protein